MKIVRKRLNMNNKKLLDKYISLIDFLGIICGPNFEIVLHDISTPEHSVIAVANGHISDRAVGAPLTDLAINLIQNKEYEKQEFVCNYAGKTRHGKQLVSSTYFIKENDTLIGLICVNHDTSALQEIRDKADLLLNHFAIEKDENKSGYQENLDSSIKNISHDMIMNTIREAHVSPDRMKAHEKKRLIKSLYEQGVFAMRGTVPLVARELGISEPTVYRYVKYIKEDI